MIKLLSKKPKIGDSSLAFPSILSGVLIKNYFDCLRGNCHGHVVAKAQLEINVTTPIKDLSEIKISQLEVKMGK